MAGYFAFVWMTGKIHDGLFMVYSSGNYDGRDCLGGQTKLAVDRIY